MAPLTRGAHRTRGSAEVDRVSIAERTIDHQAVHAKAAGFSIDEVVADNGPSGLHSRLVERPEGPRLFDKLSAGDVLVVRWADRLGRNYEDVCDTVREFVRPGIVIRTVINDFTFDGATRDPMQQGSRRADRLHGRDLSRTG